MIRLSKLFHLRSGHHIDLKDQGSWGAKKQQGCAEPILWHVQVRRP